jgi:hypothetical protein
VIRAALLKNLKVTRVDLVDKGANYDPESGEGSHVMIFKRDSSLDEKEHAMAKGAGPKGKLPPKLPTAQAKSLKPGSAGDPASWSDDEPQHRSSPANVDKDGGDAASVGDDDSDTSDADVSMDGDASAGDSGDAGDEVAMDGNAMGAGPADQDDEGDDDVSMDDSDEGDDAGVGDGAAPVAQRKRLGKSDSSVTKAEVVALQKRLENTQRELAATNAIAKRLHTENRIRKFEDKVRKEFTHLPGTNHRSLAKTLSSLELKAPQEFAEVVKLMGVWNETIKTSPMFSEIGSTGGDTEGDVVKRVTAMVEAEKRSIRKADDKRPDYEIEKAAYSSVFKKHPELYREWKAGSGIRNTRGLSRLS